MGYIIMPILGLMAYIHFVVLMFRDDSLGWIVAGTLGFPLVATLWPAIAFFGGLLTGFYALLFYGLMGLGIYMNAQQEA